MIAKDQTSVTRAGFRVGMAGRSLRLLFILLIPLAAFLCYWPAFGSYFVSDDFALLARVQDPWLTLWSPQDRWFRPVGLVFWKLTVDLFGYSAPAHHLCNFLLHLCNVVLLYLLVRATFEDRRISTLTATIFCLFPIHPEAVTWLSGRFDLLCAFFYLSSLLLLIRYLKDSSRAGLGLSALAGLLALLSKEMALSLPLVAFVLVYQQRPDLRLQQVLMKVWPFFGLTFLVVAIRIFASGSVGGYEIQFRLVWSSLRLAWSPLELLFFPWNTTLLDSVLRPAGLLFPVVTAIHLWGLSQFRTAPRTTAFLALLLYLSVLPLVNLGKVYPNLQDARYYYLPATVFALWLASFLVARRGRRLVIPLYLVTLSGLLLVHNLPWKEAGRQSSRIVDRLKSLPPGPRSLDAIPDNYLGAYVFRNGLDLVGRTVSGVDERICWRTDFSESWRGQCESGAVSHRWNGSEFESSGRY